MQNKHSIMRENFGSTLFLIGSPFQCLCMLEAIQHFNIIDYEVILTYSDDYSIKKVDTLLNEKKISYTKRNTTHIIYGVLPFLFSKHKHFKNIFIGDFYSENLIAIAYILALFRANIYFIDDGVQALSFFSPCNRKIRYKLKVKLVLYFYKLIGFVKLVRQPIFFTIYNVSSSKYKIIKNSFSLLRAKNIKEPKGIYIIGTNSSILDFKDHMYEDYIIALHQQIINRFNDEKIYYCPHRRDTNLKKIYSLCKLLNIEIFDTKVAIEYDFINNNINPKLIVGFTSNALYTLKLIFPNILIETVLYSLKNEDSDKETQIIVNRMIKSGISAIEVLK